MTTENPSLSTAAVGESAASTGSSAADISNSSTTSSATPAGATDTSVADAASTATAASPGLPTYTPNFKYKAALQEKELEEFWRPLVKDADSEKKVKELFTKVDAFDFMKNKKETLEQQYQSMHGDFEQVNQTVQRFNQSVQQGDLSSAFRLAGITKDQIFRWTQQQLELQDMPPEQRSQIEQAEAARSQKYDLEQKVTYFQQQFEHQAVQARAVQLDVALMRPEVARFAETWDRNADQSGAFKNFVIEEAKKVYYDTQRDMSPEEAINSVMQRFGKFLNVGEATVQSPQAIPQAGAQRPPPVIPNITGKAASPIKKVPGSIAELRKLAKEMGA